MRVIRCEKDSACLADLEDGKRGHEPRNADQPLERNAALWHLDFSPVRPVLDF